MNAIDVPEILPEPDGGPKVQYFTATSLDGFIADEHHSLDWLFEVPHDGADGDDGSWDEFIGRVGPMAMGATTYSWVLKHHPEMLDGPEKWREFYDDRPCWVFTHRELPRIPDIDLTFVQGDVRPVYDEMVAARPGARVWANVWIVGGGDLVGQFDDAGLLDEIWLGLTPVVLGAGAPLLPRRITSERMRFRRATQSGQRVRIVLDVSQRPRT
jgi:dihydrofolate reductase